MTYESILARSFSRHDQKKLGVGAFVGCLLIAFCFSTVFKPFLDPLPMLNLQFPFGMGLKMLMTQETIPPQKTEIKTREVKQICDFSNTWYNICEMNGDIRIHGNSSTVFVAAPTTQMDTTSTGNTSWNLKPYARKRDSIAMGRVNEFTITTANEFPPQCTQNHTVPAIVFSTGGYAGNHFHDFTDVVIPLFLTSRRFDGEVQFLVSNKQSWWINKYRAVLKKLSKYDIIDIDREEGVRCFPSMIVGLVHHKELSIDPSRSPYSMKDFREFLRNSFSLKRETAMKLKSDGGVKKPRLLIVSRKRTRSFVNEAEIADMARSLGFETVMTEADPSLRRFSELVNSCDVMMGVHGAGLTNSVFLPENAVLIQIVPLGGMEWLARTDFGEPAKDMNLKYLEYRISVNESTLIEQYPIDHPIFTGSNKIYQKGWRAFRSVYLDKQNVKLDLTRFQATLLQALELLQM